MNPASRATKLNIQQLSTFRDVYEAGGYATAAANSDLSVATIWQHIRAVEKAYGVQLFKKVGRRVKATSAATALYAAIDEILVNLDSTFDVVNHESTGTDPIRIVAGNRMMLEDLWEPLAQFHKLYPNRLTLRHGNDKRAEELLLSGDADIGLSLEAEPERQSHRIHYQPGYFVDFLAVAPKRHPFMIAASASLRELVKHPVIVTIPGTHGRDALEHALHRERLRVNIAVETDNSGFTIACAQAGIGLGILAGRPDGQLCKKLATRSLRRQLGRRQIVLMWRKGRRLTEPMLRLVELVIECRSIVT